MPNLSEPERVKLADIEFIDSIEWGGEMWQYNTTQVWKEARGRYYAASDSGCSCPQPFDGIDCADQTHGPYNKAELKSFLERKLKEEGGGYSEAELRREISTLLSRLV